MASETRRRVPSRKAPPNVSQPQGSPECATCKGSGSVDCDSCGKFGFIETGDGVWSTCAECRGSGLLECLDCEVVFPEPEPIPETELQRNDSDSGIDTEEAAILKAKALEYGTFEAGIMGDEAARSGDDIFTSVRDVDIDDNDDNDDDFKEAVITDAEDEDEMR